MTDQSNILLLITFCIFASCALIQLFYYLFFYLALDSKSHSKKGSCKEPVSVIICARNEEDNLKKFLPAVLKQDYPDFEVIVVNDCSEDNSFEILGEYVKEYPNLKISTVNKDPKFTHNKKFAQFIGIKAAKNEILIFTDADCQPESDKWIEGIVSHFGDTTSFVLGYGGYFREKGLLNKYIRYDSLFIAMQYLGMAIRKIPYMGVGRNLAYRRSVFFENNGFGQYAHIISGDDDLMVNTNATGKNTAVEFGREAHTRSVPYHTFSEWVKQKKRHFTTAPFYRFGHKFLLFLEPFTRILFYASLIVLICFLYLWPYVAGVFALRLIIQIITFSVARKKLNEPGLIGYLLFFDILSPFINGSVYLSNLRSKTVNTTWK